MSYRVAVTQTLLLFAMLLLAPFGAALEIGDRIVLDKDKPHPRLFFDREEIPAIRDFARKNSAAQPLVEHILATARAWMDREIRLPKDNINDLDEPDNSALSYHNAIRSAIEELALAYLLTGEEAFAAQTKTILLAYADKYKTYAFAGSPHGAKAPSGSNEGRLGTSSLRESAFASAFALAYDLVADSGLLSSQEKETIETNLLRELHRTMQWSKTWNEGGKATQWPNDSNHGSHRNEAVALIGYVLGDETMVNDAITGPLGLIMQAHTMYYDGGYLNEESPSYHFYALSGHLAVAEAALNNGVNLYDEVPQLKAMFDLPPYLVMPDGRMPPIGDSHTRPLPADDYALAWLRFGDDTLAGIAQGSPVYGANDGLYLLFERFDPARLPSVPMPTFESRNLPEAGLATLRGGRTNDLYALLVYGPHGGNHGHRDKLSVLFHAKGELLGFDERPEYRVHWRNTWFRQTFAHNTVAVDQQWQRHSRGQDEGFLTTPLLKLASASADASYEGVKHARNVIMVGDRYLIIVDTLEADRLRTFDWCYRSPGDLAKGFPLVPLKNGDLPPYRSAGGALSVLKNVRESPPVDGWSATWTREQAALHLTLPVGQGTSTVFTGDSPRYTHGDQEAEQDGLAWDVPMVFSRRQNTDTTFTAVLEPLDPGERPASVELLSTSFPLAVQLSWKDGTVDTVALHHPRDIASPGQRWRSDVMADAESSSTHYPQLPAFASRVSYVRRKDGEAVEFAGLDTSQIEANGMALTFAPQTNFSMSREGDDWILDHTGTTGVQATLGKAFENAGIRKGNAERELTTKTHDGEQTFALQKGRRYRIEQQKDRGRH